MRTPPTARRVLDQSMEEDELLQAITEAMTLYGYHWTHSRRSDKALTMGHPGVPDIIAARNGTVWFIELKSERGRLDPDQFGWFHALGWPATEPATDPLDIHLRVWFPSDLDTALKELA